MKKVLAFYCYLAFVVLLALYPPAHEFLHLAAAWLLGVPAIATYNYTIIIPILPKAELVKAAPYIACYAANLVNVRDNALLILGAIVMLTYIAYFAPSEGLLFPVFLPG
ncbi:MAG: hypothetical protein ACTSWP_10770 [Candidatus Freyarchaeota archaeon]